MQMPQGRTQTMPHGAVQDPNVYQQPPFMTPRMASRPRSPGSKPETENGGSHTAVGQPAWAFNAAVRMGSGEDARSVRAVSPHTGYQTRVVSAAQRGGNAQVRYVQSPTRAQGAVCVPRSPSPLPVSGVGGSVQMAQRPSGMVRTASPVAGGHSGFSWAAAPSAFSPRASQVRGTAVSRGVSPMGSPVLAPAMGPFSFTPDPPSPSLESRALSPVPGLPRFPVMQSGTRILRR
mmetsp:Transcript_7663/g.28073  ORF Transcript_7663/g.28073 Transcript_7663/m.28073 type:complete len:233 (-) Transcript_7663:189-887(-)